MPPRFQSQLIDQEETKCRASTSYVIVVQVMRGRSPPVFREPLDVLGYRSVGSWVHDHVVSAQHSGQYDLPFTIYQNFPGGKFSGRADLNRRPLAPQASALPGCATPRLNCLNFFHDHTRIQSGGYPSDRLGVLREMPGTKGWMRKAPLLPSFCPVSCGHPQWCSLLCTASA